MQIVMPISSPGPLASSAFLRLLFLTAEPTGSERPVQRFRLQGYDTIHIGFHPPTIIDETNLKSSQPPATEQAVQLQDSTALGPTPFAFQWIDLSGNPFGTNIDATGLPAGQYQLTITDGNGCETVSDVYTIEDAGNLQVPDVELTQPHCGTDGEIIIHAFNPSGAALEYSIDDGATLPGGQCVLRAVGAVTWYRLRMERVLGFYIDNPVELVIFPVRRFTQVNVTDETDFWETDQLKSWQWLSTPVIYYSIDGGTTWQSNDGNFTNLESGIYNLLIKDENGCDTTFTVEVQNIILTYLHAVTGEGGICEGYTA
jgi:hypothetical protein